MPGSPLSAPGRGGPLVCAYLGDLHPADANARNYRDLLAILAQPEVAGAGRLAFVYPPGDVANNGLPAPNCSPAITF